MSFKIRWKHLVLPVLLASGSRGLHAQPVKPYEITLPQVKITGSLYHHIQLMDLRSDTSGLGTVQIGLFNRKARVVASRPLASQLSDVLSAMIDSTAGRGELLLQLRQLSFSEVTGMSETGYCYIRAVLFAQSAGRFGQLGVLDTVIVVKSIDVTNILLRKTSNAISGFIANHLNKQPQETARYSKADMLHADSVEKTQIGHYNTSRYTDGLYTTYQSFIAQKPDQQITVAGGVNSRSVKAIDAQGNAQKIGPHNAYAFVYKGNPYIVTKQNYYPLLKNKNDLLFTSKTKAPLNTTSAITAGVFLGLIGLFALAPHRGEH